MPWTEADRANYAVVREPDASDLSNAEFALIAPLLPSAKPRGRKPTDAREILNAFFHLVRAGGPWRYLPKDFPPFTTVQNRFYAWRDSGLWDQILAVLATAIREAHGKTAAPTVVIADSQSVKTTEAGGPRGFDAGEKVKARKRHIAVDTLGLPVEYHVTTADIQDRDALPPITESRSQTLPWVRRAFVDGGYAGDETARAAFEANRIRLEVVQRTDKIQGLHRPAQALDRRAPIRLGEPRPPPR